MVMFVGVEGVGLRQSVAVAADSLGNILSAVRLVGMPLSFHTVERNVFRTRLVRLLEELCRKAGASIDDLKDAILCIGLTGVSFPYEAFCEVPDEIRNAELSFDTLICTGDAEVIFASHVQSDVGSAIVCHIGSVAYVTTPEKRIRLGGWGPAFGDEGSGYWIGRRALRAIGKEVEDGEPPSALWRCIDAWLSHGEEKSEVPDWKAASLLWHKYQAQYHVRGADPRTALLSFARSLYLQKEWEWRAIASSFVIPVMRAWGEGDRVAEEIVSTAASDLAKLYRRARQQAGGVADEGPIVLYGGVLNNNERFRGLLMNRLDSRKLLPKRVVTNQTSTTMRPACGALLFALGNSQTGKLRLPSQKKIHAILESGRVPHAMGALQND
jgi:N-acetylglucosamine kinase-like BadF-type ATPase